MSVCPKCSSSFIVGPRYHCVGGHEYLGYTCGRCGYSETGPTHDARVDSPGVIRDDSVPRGRTGW